MNIRCINITCYQLLLCFILIINGCARSSDFTFSSKNKSYLESTNKCGDGSIYNGSNEESQAAFISIKCIGDHVIKAIVDGKWICRNVAFCSSIISSIESKTLCQLVTCEDPDLSDDIPSPRCVLKMGVPNCIVDDCAYLSRDCLSDEKCHLIKNDIGEDESACVKKCFEWADCCDSEECEFTFKDFPVDGYEQKYCTTL